MKILKMIATYFSHSKKERIGILTLLVLIMASLLAPAFLSKKPQPISLTEKDTAWIARLQSSLVSDTNTERRNYTAASEDASAYQYDRSVNSPSQTATLFNFDPNTITKEQWKQLGLRDKTIQTITNYLSKGGHFYKSGDLKKIYGLHENDYNRLAPYISIAGSQKNTFSESRSQPSGHSPPPPQPESKFKTVFSQSIEVNSADKEAFVRLPGIGNVLATRIINFRDKLGGFYSIQQLSEVYGLPDSTFQTIKTKLSVDESLLKKININTATVEELKAHSYLRSVANVLLNYRKEHGNFSSILQIKNTGVVTDDTYNKVSHYLTIR